MITITKGMTMKSTITKDTTTKSMATKGTITKGTITRLVQTISWCTRRASRPE